MAYGSGIDYKRTDAGSGGLVNDSTAIAQILQEGMQRCSQRFPAETWPKWEMGRLRTFKRLGAHAHRELKSPRDFQKAGGGRSGLAHQTPKPCHPRLRRLVNNQCKSEAKTLAEVMVQEGVTTCQAAACHADSGAQFAVKLGSANIGLQSVWRLADVEFDAHLAACARVERVE